MVRLIKLLVIITVLVSCSADDPGSKVVLADPKITVWADLLTRVSCTPPINYSQARVNFYIDSQLASSFNMKYYTTQSESSIDEETFIVQEGTYELSADGSTTVCDGWAEPFSHGPETVTLERGDHYYYGFEIRQNTVTRSTY